MLTHFVGLLGGFLSLVTGRLNDKFDPRLLVTVCGFLLGLGYLLMSQINAIWQLYLFFGVIIAAGMSGSMVPLLSTVARWFVRRRALMTAFVSTGTGLGMVIMPPLARWLIATYGWRTSYIIIGVTTFVLVLILAQFLKRDPGQIGQSPYGADEVKAEDSSLDTRGFSLREAVRSRQFWLFSGIFFCT